MRIFALIILLSTNLMASDKLSFDQFIGRSLEVVSKDIKSKDASLNELVSGLEFVRFSKNEVTNQLELIIDKHEKAEFVDQNLLGFLTAPYHRHGVKYKKIKNVILFCDINETKIKSTTRKVKSKYTDSSFVFCTSFLGGKNTQSKIVIKQKEEGLLVQVSYRTFYGAFKNAKYKKSTTLLLK